jgi:molecular chaperone GrpE (heat shock protein)
MLNRLLIIFTMALCSKPAFATTGIDTLLNDKFTLFIIFANVALSYYFAVHKFDRFAVQHGPEILTTVGILGCFTGISMSLMNFDSANVGQSVPHLLEGVKTAFWASASGVAGALAIRARHHFHKLPIPQSEGAPKGATMDDLVTATLGLRDSLAGNEEGSLLSQLKLMRTDQSDQLTRLRQSFDTFAERMAKDNSKALIEALQEVIRDFNVKISEQFGDNFKQLNAAVEKLVVWQQQYKDELDKLQVTQKAGADELGKAALHLNLVTQRSETFATTAAGLDQLLRGLAQQYSLIEQSQTAMSTVLVQMKDVTPMFSRKLDELADGMKTGVTKLQAETNDVVRNFSTQVQSSHAEMKQLLADSVKQSQKELNDELIKSLETIQQAVKTLDTGLQKELTKSLEALGRQLASLSEKFVADYTPLTDRLRDVVRLAAVGR